MAEKPISIGRYGAIPVFSQMDDIQRRIHNGKTDFFDWMPSQTAGEPLFSVQRAQRLRAQARWGS